MSIDSKEDRKYIQKMSNPETCFQVGYNSSNSWGAERDSAHHASTAMIREGGKTPTQRNPQYQTHTTNGLIRTASPPSYLGPERDSNFTPYYFPEYYEEWRRKSVSSGARPQGSDSRSRQGGFF